MNHDRRPRDRTARWLIIASLCFCGSCAALNGVALAWLFAGP